MPKRAQYIVSWRPEQAQYCLAEAEDTATRPCSLEGEDWQVWLGEHRSFAFHGRAGRINLLKEKRTRGSGYYWYAYRRSGEQMLKRYAGRSVQLNLERLEEAARSRPESYARFTSVWRAGQPDCACWHARCIVLRTS